MKKILTLLLILIPLIISAYTIEETLSQIESLKKELSKNEQIVEQKIIDLKEKNPLFAVHGQFESSNDYIKRVEKGQPIVDNIRKQYLDDLQEKLTIIRGRFFDTENINITLEKYDPDKQIYRMTIKHLDYQRENYHIKANIRNEIAKSYNQNWNKVKKTGILTIGIDDNICLQQIRLQDPISSNDFSYRFPIYFYINFVNIVSSVTFSPNGTLLAIGTNSTDRLGNHIFLYDLEKQRKIYSFGNRIGNSNGETHVRFDKNNKYFIAEYSEYSSLQARDQEKVILYDISNGDWQSVIRKDYLIFNKAGIFICTIEDPRITSPDRKYKINNSGKTISIHRTFAKVKSDIIEPKIILHPPSLLASVSFIESSGNHYLDALEKGYITITITNKGKGPGKGLTIKLDPEIIEGLNYNNSYIDEIPAGKSKTVKIPIEAYMDVLETNNLVKINFDELNGFPPDPVEIEFSTKAYQKPVMHIVDVGIEDSNNNGMIETGETTKLTLRIGNKGKGIATGAYAKIYSEKNVFITDSYPNIVNLGDLRYNHYVDVPLEFFVNDKAPEKIPLYVDLTEATGMSGVDHLRIPILKTDRARKIMRTVVTGIDESYGDLDFNEDLSIDIEDNIPSGSKRNDILAIIFGIEKYKNVSNVSFAHRDARFMKEYFNNTIGISENNIYYVVNEDVSKAVFDKVFSKGGWLDKRVKVGKSEIYFFYAGHGAPDIKESKAYLIPYDGDPNYASQTGYEMEKIYNYLADLNAKSVTVFLDACFSGANRESEMLLTDARPLMIEVKSPIAKGITVFSATGTKEISSAWRDKKHGLFSYFLMKGMQGQADVNKDNRLTIKELGDYIYQKVSEQAGYLDREQTPEMISDDEDRIIINY